VFLFSAVLEDSLQAFRNKNEINTSEGIRFMVLVLVMKKIKKKD
jgi:hypothetical protein